MDMQNVFFEILKSENLSVDAQTGKFRWVVREDTASR